MKKPLRSTVHLLLFASIFSVYSCVESNQPKEEIQVQPSFTELAPVLIDSVRKTISVFGSKLNTSDSVQLVKEIRKMHRGTFFSILRMDTLPAPQDDSLMWTAAMSLKNFYSSTMHQFCNEALRFVIIKEKTPQDNRRIFARLKEEMAQEEFFYQNYQNYLPKEKQQPFISVYEETYTLFSNLPGLSDQ